jgi:transposase-like protein
MDEDKPPPVPLCPRCNSEMTLLKSTPHLGRLPRFETYFCNDCGQVETVKREGS